MKNQDIDQLFSDAFKQQEVTPPKDIWSGLEAQLDQKKIKKLQTRKLIMQWSVAAAVLLALGLVLNIYTTQNEEIVLKNTKKVAQQPVRKEKLTTPDNSILSPKVFDQEIIPSRKPAIDITKKENTPERKENTSPEVNIKESVALAALSDSQLSIGEQENAEIHLNEWNESATVNTIATFSDIDKEETTHKSEHKKERQTLFTKLLNTISDNFNPTSKALKFSSDNEGSLKIDVSNSIANN